MSEGIRPGGKCPVSAIKTSQNPTEKLCIFIQEIMQ